MGAVKDPLEGLGLKIQEMAMMGLKLSKAGLAGRPSAKPTPCYPEFRKGRKVDYNCNNIKPIH